VIQSLDPLTLPLSGLRAVEASAGTGKTWTLSALYVRLVLGHAIAEPLNPPQILVMTFTELATAELRGRIRTRLYEAAQYFRTPDIESEIVDDFLQKIKSSFEKDSWNNCANRLDLAAQWMDEAAIFTIHAWSARMLKEHAFDSKSLFEQTLIEDAHQLRLEAAREYWRKYFYPLTYSQLKSFEELKLLVTTPDDLLDRLRPVFAKKSRSPEDQFGDGISPLQFEDKLARWKEDLLVKKNELAREWTEEFIEKIKTEINARKKIGSISSDEYTSRKVTIRLSKVMEFFSGGEIDEKLLKQFSASELSKNGWPQAESLPTLKSLDDLCHMLTLRPGKDSLLEHAAKQIDIICSRSKSLMGQFDFADLLQNLYKAVNADGSKLAQTIREQYPVALVDEFQDTDPWQYGALKKIYVEEERNDSGLIIIGDPKQAIYGFRGADLQTYLQAIRDAKSNIYTLLGNYRSTQQLVDAVNHIFLNAQNPFGSVEFPKVIAKKEIEPLVTKSGQQPALTVWLSNSSKPLSKEKYKKEMAALFAGQIAELLNKGFAQPSEMAVLVRDVKEATSIRGALEHLGVRSVYLSDQDSVYAAEEALELRLILQAIANPKSTSLMRSAVATRIFGLDFSELDQLIHNEVQWENLVEKFHRYQSVWQRQGFLPMLQSFIHENDIARKLLNPSNFWPINGERVLTNLLHLGDLLQNASLQLHGEGALIRYLEEQLSNPKSAGDSAVVRLESEANLVKVLTIHKSKGLQFPLVFLPFISNFKVEESNSARDDKSRISEDIRLLYVALTRAEKALWMGVATMVGDFPQNESGPKSAISQLLGRVSADDLKEKLQLWRSCSEISVSPAPETLEHQYKSQSELEIRGEALQPKKVFNQSWWIASFSSISKGLAGEEVGGSVYYQPNSRDEKLADSQQDNAQPIESEHLNVSVSEGVRVQNDELEPSSPFDTISSSSSVGTLLHDLLEWQFNRGWPISADSLSPLITAEWNSCIDGKSVKLGLTENNKTVLKKWVQTIVETKFSSNKEEFAFDEFLLNKLNSQNAWAEMGFTLPVKSMNVSKLDALITSNVLARELRPALQPRQLSGMLTGFMDLVVEHDGRYFVIDYKSNKLNSYITKDLSHSILTHRYDVQYTLYLVALHRLLKSRLDDYDYDRHVGGAVYLYLRGVQTESKGLFVDRPPKSLILSIDDAFRGS